MDGTWKTDKITITIVTKSNGIHIRANGGGNSFDTILNKTKPHKICSGIGQTLLGLIGPDGKHDKEEHITDMLRGINDIDILPNGNLNIQSIKSYEATKVPVSDIHPLRAARLRYEARNRRI